MLEEKGLTDVKLEAFSSFQQRLWELLGLQPNEWQMQCWGDDDDAPPPEDLADFAALPRRDPTPACRQVGTRSSLSAWQYSKGVVVACLWGCSSAPPLAKSAHEELPPHYRARRRSEKRCAAGMIAPSRVAD